MKSPTEMVSARRRLSRSLCAEFRKEKHVVRIGLAWRRDVFCWRIGGRRWMCIERWPQGFRAQPLCIGRGGTVTRRAGDFFQDAEARRGLTTKEEVRDEVDAW